VIVFWIPTGAVWGGVEAQTVPTAGPTATETAKPTVANTQVPIVYPTYTNTPDFAPQTATAIVYEAQLTATAISEQAMLTVTALYQGAYQTATAGAQQAVLTSTALKQQLNATQTAQAALAKPVPSQTPTPIGGYIQSTFCKFAYFNNRDFSFSFDRRFLRDSWSYSPKTGQ